MSPTRTRLSKIIKSHPSIAGIDGGAVEDLIDQLVEIVEIVIKDFREKKISIADIYKIVEDIGKILLDIGIISKESRMEIIKEIVIFIFEEIIKHLFPPKIDEAKVDIPEEKKEKLEEKSSKS